MKKESEMRNIAKKTSALLLCLLLTFSAISCGNSADTPAGNESDTQAITTTAEETTQPELMDGLPNTDFGGYEFRMKARAYEIYLEKADEWVKVYPWSKPLIDLFSKKYKLAVASASDRVKVECNLRCIGADPSVFSALITGSDVKNKKPAPDIFLLAAERAGFDSKSAVVFEDAVSGVMAAKAAGCVCIAVTTSFPAGQAVSSGS